ncbi:hypothetical protein D3C72_2148480 [compost metagenome]
MPSPAFIADGVPAPPPLRREAQARSCGPKANMAVAASSSQGTILRKVASGVNSSSAAPSAPPASASTTTAFMDRPGGDAMSSLKPQAPAA